jgi:cellulose synthase/poly-beta-1,6-N-acetylglucosamine synthase-like glycosyltransferase
MLLKILFWTLLFLIFYTYFGYPVLMAFCRFGRQLFQKKSHADPEIFQPEVTLLVAAYNEKDSIPEKINNTFSQDYPQNRIRQVWVTDGSTDGTPEILSNYPEVTIIHHPERLGKSAAINRAMRHIHTPITIFTDANAMLSPNAFSELVKPFIEPSVGCVAGEKGISMHNSYDLITSCEGIYWKYESMIKKLESGCGSAVSAAGELYAIRTELFPDIEEDIILDDFFVSSQITKKGFRIKYAPGALATEKASINIREERKRKVRIAAGSFQFLFRNSDLLHPFKNPLFAFQYFSHKVLRWVLVPFAMILLPWINLALVVNEAGLAYQITLSLALVFFMTALFGWLFSNTRLTNRFIFLPFYLVFSNSFLFSGLVKYLRGKGNPKWEKSVRQT